MATFRQEYKRYMKIINSKKYTRVIDRAKRKFEVPDEAEGISGYVEKVVEHVGNLADKFDNDSSDVYNWLCQSLIDDVYGGLDRFHCPPCDHGITGCHVDNSCGMEDEEYLYKYHFNSDIPLSVAHEKYEQLTDKNKLQEAVGSVVDDLMFYVENGVSPSRIRNLIKSDMNQRIVKPVQEA